MRPGRATRSQRPASRAPPHGAPPAARPPPPARPRTAKPPPPKTNLQASCQETVQRPSTRAAPPGATPRTDPPALHKQHPRGGQPLHRRRAVDAAPGRTPLRDTRRQ
eukprot:5242461-Alexandrium_andersonii.AAC.1